jgi:uncharacterized protein YndB with AHSA1/START domain
VTRCSASKPYPPHRDRNVKELPSRTTKPDAMVLWMGEFAHLDAKPGGEFRVDVRGTPVRGRFLELDPPHRLVIAWGYAGSEVLPPGASTVEVRLSAEAGGTRVQLEHRDLPAEEISGHATGWAHYLGRLRVVAGGGDPGQDPGMNSTRATAPPPDERGRDGAPNAEAAFRHVAARMRGEAGVGKGRALHAPSLKIDGRIFAMLVHDRLVVKLPAERCSELIGDGAAEPFISGRRKMREWVAVPSADTSLWVALAEEALRFVRG